MSHIHVGTTPPPVYVLCVSCQHSHWHYTHSHTSSSAQHQDPNSVDEHFPWLTKRKKQLAIRPRLAFVISWLRCCVHLQNIGNAHTQPECLPKKALQHLLHWKQRPEGTRPNHWQSAASFIKHKFWWSWPVGAYRILCTLSFKWWRSFLHFLLLFLFRLGSRACECASAFCVRAVTALFSLHCAHCCGQCAGLSKFRKLDFEITVFFLGTFLVFCVSSCSQESTETHATALCFLVSCVFAGECKSRCHDPFLVWRFASRHPFLCVQRWWWGEWKKMKMETEIQVKSVGMSDKIQGELTKQATEVCLGQEHPIQKGCINFRNEFRMWSASCRCPPSKFEGPSELRCSLCLCNEGVLVTHPRIVAHPDDFWRWCYSRGCCRLGESPKFCVSPQVCCGCKFGHLICGRATLFHAVLVPCVALNHASKRSATVKLGFLLVPTASEWRNSVSHRQRSSFPGWHRHRFHPHQVLFQSPRRMRSLDRICIPQFGWDPEGWGPGRVGGPQISAFFPSPATVSLFLSLWVSSRGILVVFEAPRGSNAHVLEFSGSCASPGGPVKTKTTQQQQQQQNWPKSVWPSWFGQRRPWPAVHNSKHTLRSQGRFDRHQGRHLMTSWVEATFARFRLAWQAARDARLQFPLRHTLTSPSTRRGFISLCWHWHCAGTGGPLLGQQFYNGHTTRFAGCSALAPLGFSFHVCPKQTMQKFVSSKIPSYVRGKKAMNKPEVKSSNRWNDYLEQHRESARGIDGEKIQFVSHMLLGRKDERDRAQRIRVGQGERGQNFAQKSVFIEFYSWEWWAKFRFLQKCKTRKEM